MVIKSTIAALAILLGSTLWSGQPATADSCGGVAVPAGCAGAHDAIVLRRGQVRRAHRRAARAARRSYRDNARAACGVAVTCAAPARCGGVLVAVPAVTVEVNACPSCE